MKKIFRSTRAAAFAGLLVAAAFAGKGAHASVVRFAAAERDHMSFGVGHHAMAHLDVLQGHVQRSAAQWATVPSAFVQMPNRFASRSNLPDAREQAASTSLAGGSTALKVLMGLALCAVVVRRQRHRI